MFSTAPIQQTLSPTEAWLFGLMRGFCNSWPHQPTETWKLRYCRQFYAYENPLPTLIKVQQAPSMNAFVKKKELVNTGSKWIHPNWETMTRWSTPLHGGKALKKLVFDAVKSHRRKKKCSCFFSPLQRKQGREGRVERQLRQLQQRDRPQHLQNEGK